MIFDELISIITEITSEKDMNLLFTEILTPSELKDLSMRWNILKELQAGVSQRDIAKRNHLSLCKITRGSKVLKCKDSICKKILNERNKRDQYTLGSY